MSSRRRGDHQAKSVRDGVRPPRGRAVVLGLLLVAATLVAHFPAIRAGYVWDDGTFLTDNPLIHARDGLYRFWFTTEPEDYFPLTSTMLWVEWRLWGRNPMPYHVGNILLHAAGAVLLWRVLRRLKFKEPAAYFAAMIFAVHPVTVASVAWITERKNVLPMALYLLSILAYLRFEDEGRRRWYALALLAAAAAFLAKTSVVMLPFVLLLLCWWRRGRIGREDLLRVAPFLVMSLVLGLATMWFQHHNVIRSEVVRPEGLASRIAASGWIVWFYLYKIVLPINLIMIYPRWDVDGGRAISFVPLGLLIGCFVVFWVYRRTWGRGLLAGLGYFVIVLVPVLGFVDMAFLRYSLVSDHLQYAAMPGVIVPVAALVTALASWGRACRPRLGPAAAVAAAFGVVFVLAILTRRQAETFRNAETLWDHTLRLNDRAWVAYNNRGIAYNARGDHDRAIADYTRAIELRPGCAEAYYNRGIACARLAHADRAIRDFTRAVELKPDYAEAWYNRGVAYDGRGAFREAIADYTRAIELDPNRAEAYSNRGISHAELGQADQAIDDFTKAIELKSDYAAAYYNRGMAYYRLKAYDKAWADVRMFRQLGGTPSPQLVRMLVEATGWSE